MFDYLLLFFIPWPIVNLFFLIKAILSNEDIGFVLYYRLFLRIHGPYDLILSDFFSRITSIIIVLIGIVISGVFTWWIYML